MNATMSVRRPRRGVWLPVLGLFTLWLVVQNAVLITIVSLVNPQLPVQLLVEAARMAARVVGAGGEIIVSLATGMPGWLTTGMLTALKGGVV